MTIRWQGSIGFGTHAIGGYPPHRPPVDSEIFEDILSILESRGFTWIDTAGVYGLGSVEEMIARARRSQTVKDHLSVVTKCGIGWSGKAGNATIRHRADPSSLRSDCLDSLRRLGLDSLDCLLLHHRDGSGIPVDDSWGTLTTLRDEGLVQKIGVSNLTIAELESCARTEVPSFHQFTVQMPDRELDSLVAWGDQNDCISMLFGVVRASRVAQPRVPVSTAVRTARVKFASASLVLGASKPGQVKELATAWS